MRLFEENIERDFLDKADVVYFVRNPKVEYVTFCECGGYGVRNKCGRDEFCPDCGKWLDWSKEQKW